MRSEATKKIGRTLALSAVSAFLTGCTAHSRGDTAAAAAAAAAAAPSTQPAAVQVVIDNFSFTPEELHVKRGTTVTWVNHDDVPHTATSSAKPRAFHSGTLDTDAKFSFTFADPGEYPYFCAVHPHMTGKVVVEAK